MIKNTIITIIIIASIWVIYFLQSDKPNTKLIELKEKFDTTHIKPVDHSKFAILQKKFSKPQEVTEACISCHTERHKEIMATNHWTWDKVEYIQGRGIVKIGKKNIINNYCIGISSNEGTCNKCHAGFGWADKTFDFSNPSNVDCMVCHDNSGTYEKASGGAGYPDPKVDLNLVAQSAGLPKKENCGYCHFLGGGGNNVKHGDLELALLSTSRKIDVHMAKDGFDMRCTHCHQTQNHKIKGRMYSVSSTDHNRLFCEDCHTTQPHTQSIINEHTLKVACQTCHIPVFAKVNPTKMFWDWEKACKIMDPKYKEVDSTGVETYLAIKGAFKWAKNAKPEYVWFNGTADHYLLGDKVDSTKTPIRINTFFGNYNDPKAKIIPVKNYLAKQIWDPVNMTLIQPKLWDKEEGNNALWVDCKFTPIKVMWNLSAKAGMDYIGLPYSGRYSFILTQMYWPINHMVSPKDEALKCKDCHTREGGRLDKLRDFYMPGRDRNKIVDLAGTTFIILTLIGTLTHGALRIFFKKRKK